MTHGGGQSAVRYLGWHGRGNIGDDAIYDAVRAQFPGIHFLDVPEIPRERLAARVDQLRNWRQKSTLVIGGGTVVGRSSWRRLVGRGLALSRNPGGYAIGIGVEDPVFQGTRSHSGNDELSNWPAMLSRFHTVSVRGPRSAELLSDLGMDVRVSGDPALVLSRPDVLPEEGLIGLNVGFGDDLWGHNPAGLADEIAAAVKQLGDRGFRFVGILMNEDDRTWTQNALRGVVADIVMPADAADAARELARCSAVIVSRLHAGILAALSETPVIALEYQPKCRDFALSIDDERSLIRTDKLTAEVLLERVLATIEDAERIRATTASAVAVLRDRLLADYVEARQRLKLEDV